MSLESIVDVQIDKQTASVSRVGFGTPLIMSAEATSVLGTTAKLYEDTASMITDGFASTGIAVGIATRILAQNPKVSQFILGKRATLQLQTINIIPVVVDTTLYRATINGVNMDFTSDGTAALPEIIAGLVGVINGSTENVLATDIGAGTSLRIEAAASPGGAATAGVPFSIVTDRTLLPRQDDTPDPGIVADLTAVRTALDGNDDWYAVVLDSHGQPEIEALAAHIETLRKIFLASTSDVDVLTASITDVGSVLQSNTYERTAIIWHDNPHLSPEGAWGGVALPTDPGSITWKFKTLAGITNTLYTPAEDTFAKNKGVNRYAAVAGNNITCDGVMAGGEFIDVVRGLDFVVARLKEDVFGQLLRSPKIPFTDPGIASIESVVRSVMDLAVNQGIFAGGEETPTVTVPKAVDVSINDRANRLLPDVKFSARLAGAIHEVEIRGTVTV